MIFLFQGLNKIYIPILSDDQEENAIIFLPIGIMIPARFPDVIARPPPP
jgi:hypothetical protein